MSERIEPRAGSGCGCLGKGCLLSVALLLLLVVAFVGGGFWALRHVQNTYSSTEPLTFGNVSSSDSAAPLPTESAAPQTEETADGEGATMPDQTAPPSTETVREVQARWRAFERAADRHQPAHIELSQDDINALISNDPKLRGKALVSVNGNTARVRVSMPLDGMFMMSGRYLNGEATVQPSPDGDPANARITNIKFGSQSVPDETLDRRLFGWSSIRGYMTDWLEDKDIRYFTIQNGHVIGESGGRPQQ